MTTKAEISINNISIIEGDISCEFNLTKDLWEPETITLPMSVINELLMAYKNLKCPVCDELGPVLHCENCGHNWEV